MRDDDYADVDDPDTDWHDAQDRQDRSVYDDEVDRADWRMGYDHSPFPPF